MRCTQNYFCYCSLQDQENQIEVLGRSLQGKKDYLPNFHTFKKNNMGPYVQESKNKLDKVKGTLYKISNHDLFLIDAYEETNFRSKRIKTTLKSGTSAWVYVDNPA